MNRQVAAYVAGVALSIALAVFALGGSSGTPSATSNCATRNGVPAPVHEAGSTNAAGDVINLDAGDMYFSPTCVVDVPVGTVTLVIYNSGTRWHNFSVPAQHIDRDLPPDSAILVRVSVTHNAVMFNCKYQRMVGMVGILVPQPSRPGSE